MLEATKAREWTRRKLFPRLKQPTIHQADTWATVHFIPHLYHRDAAISFGHSLKPATLPSSQSWNPLWASSFALPMRAFRNASLQETAFSPWDMLGPPYLMVLTSTLKKVLFC